MSQGDQPSDAPMSYVLRLRERAVRDITAAYVRFAEVVSLAVADEWRDGLMAEIAGLAMFPRRYPLAPDRFRREVRQLRFQRPGSQVVYRVLFTMVGEEAQSADPPTVIILHVRHATTRPLTRAQIREIESAE